MFFLSRAFVVMASLEPCGRALPSSVAHRSGRILVGPRPGGPFASRGSGWGGSQRFGADSRRHQSLRRPWPVSTTRLGGLLVVDGLSFGGDQGPAAEDGHSQRQGDDPRAGSDQPCPVVAAG